MEGDEGKKDWPIRCSLNHILIALELGLLSSKAQWIKASIQSMMEVNDINASYMNPVKRHEYVQNTVNTQIPTHNEEPPYEG